MPTRNDKEKWKRADDEVRQKLPPGVKLLRTLRGHTDSIGRIAWSPDGRMLASPSDDNTIRLWDAKAGEYLREFKGQNGGFGCVAFDPASLVLVGGGDKQIIELWELGRGKLLHKLKGSAHCLSFDRDGRTLASGYQDEITLWNISNATQRTKLPCPVPWILSIKFYSSGKILVGGGSSGPITFWDTETGKSLSSIDHPSYLWSIALDPLNLTIASSASKTIKFWDAKSSRLLRTVEGHTEDVKCVDFLFNGQLLASKSDDGTIRFWKSDTGACLAIIPEVSSENWRSSLTFHPYLPLLAVVGSDPGTPKKSASNELSVRDRVIHLYELDLDLLLGQPAKPSISYTSAKVVLVGESNVGKSYLAHRITSGEAPEEGAIKSTHGMRFWPLDPKRLSPGVRTSADQRRDVVLWDMGGQDEYRLIHQLFLHDTTLALVLFDPTRGASAIKEVETWNKALENQLKGRAAVKLLVGAKLDQPSDTIDQQAVERLLKDCGFSGYYETSALTGRGTKELCEAAAKAIDWDGLGKTSRPELFQNIRDEIESRRKRGEVVLHLIDLQKNLGLDWSKAQKMSYPDREDSTTDMTELEASINAVTEQLASQGIIARSKVSTGEPVLVLQVQEIERYAGSLIIAAKKNPRGVPALELRAIAQENFLLPGIPDTERLPREQEKPVLECTVQLMLEHGICFQHEGLLIFPSLFAPAPEGADGKLLHSVSLYYDFAGAIDNIYASMVAWLVLAKEFGKVRLWSERAEFEIKAGGLCGLRKVGRPGGFAHVDVYFEQATPEQQRKEFISFVEDHLARNGVEIREHVAVKCPCGHQFAEDTLRQRIARGDKDVGCPVCEKRHSLTEGASESRERDAKISQHTWALRTRIEKLREKITKSAVQALGRAEDTKPTTGPIRLLHLSDLHFTSTTPVTARLQWLLDDIKQDSGLGFKELDYLVISGDFTDKGGLEGFEKAYDFVSGLTQEFGLSAERCIFVPGNHDLRDLRESYEWRDKAGVLKTDEYVQQGEVILARDHDKYPLRLKAFSDLFYHKFLQRPYPLEPKAQGMAIPFWETGIQFLPLNSCWQIDQFFRKRSGVNVEAVANTLKHAQQQENEARKTGLLAKGKPILRIAVWHHAVAGPEMMNDTAFLTNLQKAGVRVGMHGDVHELRRDVIGHWHGQGKQLHILGAGSFGSPPEGRPESMPRLYNVIEIDRSLTCMKVHTRQQPTPDGAWSGWYEWPNPKDSKSKVDYYDIQF